jgi:hypothetical protein
MDRSDIIISFLDEIEVNPKLIPRSMNEFPIAEEDDLEVLEYYFNKPNSWLKNVVFKIMARDLPQHLLYGRIEYFLESPVEDIRELANRLLIIKNTGNSQEEISEAVSKILV